MKQIEKIMVPVAFSSHSTDLVSYAASLASVFDADLVLVNIIHERDVETVQTITSFGYDVDEEDYIKEIESDRMKKLEHILDNVDYPDSRIRMVFKVGHPADALLKLAVKEGVDMIVMGIREKTDFLHTLTGSVADKVFRRSPITIVSFRDDKNAGHLRKRLLG